MDNRISGNNFTTPMVFTPSNTSSLTAPEQAAPIVLPITVLPEVKTNDRSSFGESDFEYAAAAKPIPPLAPTPVPAPISPTMERENKNKKNEEIRSFLPSAGSTKKFSFPSDTLPESKITYYSDKLENNFKLYWIIVSKSKNNSAYTIGPFADESSALTYSHNIGGDFQVYDTSENNPEKVLIEYNQLGDRRSLWQ